MVNSYRNADKLICVCTVQCSYETDKLCSRPLTCERSKEQTFRVYLEHTCGYIRCLTCFYWQCGPRGLLLLSVLPFSFSFDLSNYISNYIDRMHQRLNSVHSSHTVALCVAEYSHNKPRIFHQTALTIWSSFSSEVRTECANAV